MPASAAMNSMSAHLSANLNNTVTNEDLAPICNGSGTVRWISLSQYYQTGKIQFVEPPLASDSENNNQSDNNITKCPTCLLFNHIDDDNSLLNFSVNLPSIDHYQAPLAVLSQLRNTPNASANSRAPPLTC